MIRSILILFAMPIGGVLAQNPPPAIYLLISSPNRAAFQISRPSSDSGRGPLLARGRLEIAADMGEVRVTSLDTLNSVHVDATQNGRVIASGDGAYVMVRREASGVAIEARSQAPTSAAPGSRRQK